MANLIINGSAGMFWKALITQRSRKSSHTRCFFQHNPVNVFCAHSFFDLFADIIKHSNVNLGAFFDSGNLVRRFYHIVIRHDMAGVFKPYNFFVKCLMAGFVFFPAVAPALIISP